MVCHRALARGAPFLEAGTADAKGVPRPFQCVLTEKSLPSPGPEILDYLSRHPDAQDTIDGILHWWVLDSCIRKWAPKIAETLAHLVEKGFLEERTSADGRLLYRVSSRHLAKSGWRAPAPD